MEQSWRYENRFDVIISNHPYYHGFLPALGDLSFSMPGETEKIAGFSFAWEDQHQGSHYTICLSNRLESTLKDSLGKIFGENYCEKIAK